MTIRIAPVLLWLLAVLFVAALVHLGSILMLPRLARQNGYDKLAADQPVGTVVRLAGAPTGLAPPYADPAISSALCRYDLSAGPMRITAAADEAEFFAVSFHSRSGLPFYALTDRASVDGRIDVLLTTAAQQERLEAADGDEPARDVRIVAPQAEGFVQFDVLPRIGRSAAAEQAWRSMRCKVEASP